MNDILACLNKFGDFKKLAEKHKSKSICKSMRLFTYSDYIVYLWNETENTVESIDIKPILNGLGSGECVSFRLKPLLCFQVECISVNSSNSIVCLYGPKGLAVCKLPDRCLLLNNIVELDCDYLAQKVFICDYHLVRWVSWHPGSVSDSHLLLLTSDEVLRLYNTLDCSLVWEYCLTDRYIRGNLPSKISLGETPVCFDFGPSEFRGDDLIFPIYIVWGNGDVYKVDSRLDDIGFKMKGLLRYEPSAVDNYGADASSIIVMDSNPPLVAIATCKGRIHHCLLLKEESEYVLHVFETLELELGLEVTSEKEEDIVSSPIRLEKDPNMSSRYFCFHRAGIHSIYVPMVDKLSNFNENFNCNLDHIVSSIDYLLCTSLNGDVQSSPTLGVAFVDLTKIFVLISSGKLIKVPLYIKSEQNLDVLSPNKEIEKVKEDDYKMLVAALIKENGVSTFPIVKLNGDIMPSDIYKIVHRATISLRAVFKCHSEVLLKIRQKVDSLKSHLVKQSKEMENLKDHRSSLRSSAEQIAEKYEEINEKQNELVKRTERLLLKIECSGNRSSCANEKKMIELMGKAKEKLMQLESDVVAVQSFYSTFEGNDVKQTAEKDLPSAKKLHMLSKSLKHLGNDLCELKSRILVAKDTVEHCQF